MNAVVREWFGDERDTFAADVIAGLSQRPKSLPCKWFYDEAGSELFEAITRTPEYYPTRVETRLLRSLLPELIEHAGDTDVVIEPGSGSSIKTRLLLDALPQLKSYQPIDISSKFLLDSAHALRKDYPRLRIEPRAADFTALIEPFRFAPAERPLVFFPGSTIGNFAPDEAVTLLAGIRRAAGPRSRLLIGVDMTQDAAQLEAAYDDAAGVTARFNLNLLVRANRELGMDFDVDAFAHQARFDARHGRIEMHLVSERRQRVRLCKHAFELARGETIHTENSYKHRMPEFAPLLARGGWSVAHSWQDQEESGFSVLLLNAKEMQKASLPVARGLART